MFKKIENYCLQENLITPNSTLIIGLSGGPDSVFLAYFLQSIQQKYNLTLIAAHLNHGWRQEAINDAQFCKQLAQSLNITFIEDHAQNIAIARKLTGSQEDLGRQLRRVFFAQVAQEYTAPSIALAHHQDDMVETFFIRLLRGAGVTGLASIRAKQENYIRPLLCVTKQEILAYLAQHTIPYCIDVTNEHTTYLRNRIRKYLIPAATHCDARAPKTIVNTIEQLQATDDFLATLTHETYARVAPDTILNLQEFAQLHPFLQKRVLLMWLCAYKVPFTPSESFYNELIRFLLYTHATKHTVSTWFIIKQGHTASIIKKHL